MAGDDFAERVCSRDDRPVWLAARRTGIGSSDAPCLMGCGYQSVLAIWAEKRGLIQPPDLDDIEAVRLGRELEDFVATQYASDRYTGRAIARAEFLYRSTEHPWALCTPDYWVEIDDDPVPLEIKTTAAYRTEDWIDGPPERVRWQVQHQMLVFGSPRVSAACLIGGQKIVWADIERDETAIEALIDAGSRLWAQIESGDPPAPDASESSTRALKLLYPAETPGREIILGDEIAQWDAQRVHATARIAHHERIKRAADNTIRAAMQDAEVAWLPDGSSYTYRVQKRPEHTVRASSPRVLLRRKSRRG